jgi:hypothetical protein
MYMFLVSWTTAAGVQRRQHTRIPTSGSRRREPLRRPAAQSTISGSSGTAAAATWQNAVPAIGDKKTTNYAIIYFYCHQAQPPQQFGRMLSQQLVTNKKLIMLLFMFHNLANDATTAVTANDGTTTAATTSDATTSDGASCFVGK